METPAGFSAADLDTLARTLYGEARGETDEGRLAVACVVLNRLRRARTSPSHARRWGSTVDGVCRKARQFSCWNLGDPNLKRIQGATSCNPLFVRCREIAHDALTRFEALADPAVDPSGGATHYINPACCNPKWDDNLRVTARIGRHTFFYEP